MRLSLLLCALIAGVGAASAYERSPVCKHLPCSHPHHQRPAPHISDEFHLTQAVPGVGGAQAAPVNLPREITRRLWRCLNAAAGKTDADREITLRIAFSRGGTVLGIPKITYVKAADKAQGDALRAALGTALRACTPLPFTPSLGSAIAGRILNIRFVLQSDRLQST